jgi:acetyl-CoA carboxylase biotin carboxyl carrier protein
VAALKKTARRGGKGGKSAKTNKKAAPKVAAKAVAKPRKATGKAAGKKRSAAKATTAASKTVAKAASRTGRPATARKSTARKTTRRPVRKRASAASAASFPEVSALAELMEQHGLIEVDYEQAPDGSKRIHVTRAGGEVVMRPVAQAPAAAAPVAAEAGAAPAASPPAIDEGLHAFKSPMVGTFYRAPSPEASPFASVGDKVDPNSVVCIIEAMKVMNEINPDAAGEVVSIEVENGEAVEFGQTLMLLRSR